MKKHQVIVLIISLMCIANLFAQEKPVAWCAFDDLQTRRVRDSINDIFDKIHGNFWFEEGVSGQCLKLDGYKTHVVRDVKDMPILEDDFTVEAWVAPHVHPWNWTGIIDQEKDKKEGFFFGVSADGNVGLGMAAINDGQWHICISKGRIEPLKCLISQPRTAETVRWLFISMAKRADHCQHLITDGRLFRHCCDL